MDGDTSKIPSSVEIARLRQGKEEHWFWFAGSLLETVAGVRNGWGQEKYFIKDIAQAEDTKGRAMEPLQVKHLPCYFMIITSTNGLKGTTMVGTKEFQVEKWASTARRHQVSREEVDGQRKV